MSKAADLKVFITTREATCDECGDVLGRGAWITLEEEKGALHLAVAAHVRHWETDYDMYLVAGRTDGQRGIGLAP